jgi:poly(3-hydroxyalkanoate) synthetase
MTNHVIRDDTKYQSDADEWIAACGETVSNWYEVWSEPFVVHDARNSCKACLDMLAILRGLGAR